MVIQVNPTFRDIEWASFLYTVTTGFDESYANTMSKLDRYRPFENSIPEGDSTLGKEIIYFLHRWHTQGVPNTSKVPLTKRIRELSCELDSLHGTTLHEVSAEEAEGIYERISSPKIEGFGPTAIAKTLHILCPNTFVMWDTGIREDFQRELKNQGKRLGKKSEIYGEFIKEMSRFAKLTLNDTAITSLNEIIGKITRGRPFFPKTEAKLVDEYNWLTKVKKVDIPFRYSLEETLKFR